MAHIELQFLERVQRITKLASILGLELRKGYFERNYTVPPEWDDLCADLQLLKPEQLDSLPKPAKGALRDLARLVNTAREIQATQMVFGDEFHQLFSSFCSRGRALDEALRAIPANKHSTLSWAEEEPPMTEQNSAAIAGRTEQAQYDAALQVLNRLAATHCTNPQECLAWCNQAMNCLKEFVQLDGNNWEALSSPAHRLASEAAKRAIQVGADANTLAFLQHLPADRSVMTAHTGLTMLQRFAEWCAAKTQRRDEGTSSPDKTLDEEAQNNSGRKRRRGRRTRYDAEADAAMAERWKHAHSSNVEKKQFAEDNGISLRELDRLLNRHAKRAKARK